MSKIICTRVCEYGQSGCGEYYDCGICARKKRAAAYRELTPEQKAYDRYVDPVGAYHDDFPSGCSCHINPPCSFCVNAPEPESAEGESWTMDDEPHFNAPGDFNE